MSADVEVRFLPGRQVTRVAPGSTLLAAARRAGVSLEAPCDGAGICGKCRVQVHAAHVGALDPGVKGRRDGDRLSVLACDARVRAPLEVTVGDCSDRALKIVDHGMSTPWPLAPFVTILRTGEASVIRGGHATLAAIPGVGGPANLGLAIDIGTTTLVVALVDLDSGAELALASGLNPQANYGHDVLSRIRYASEPGGLRVLQCDLIERLNQLIAQVCARAGHRPADIHEAVLGGNTCMLHLAAGVDPSPLGRAPYQPALRGGHHVQAAELGLNIAGHGLVYLPPVISGFVGADITAGILATDLHRSAGTTLLIDIGTNGEMVLAADGELWATSTAAGPAFEGVNITCGMRAAPGAIDAVSVNEDGTWTLHTIGDAPAAGLCGSGLIDLASRLIDHGVIGKSGRFQRDGAPPVGTWVEEAGRWSLRLSEDVVLSQNDVRQVQLAKAAIRAGLEVLLARAECSEADVDRVLVAGSFGYHLRADSLRGSGLLPAGLAAKVEAAGNTCKTGAVTLLTSTPARSELGEVAARVRAVELSEDSAFARRFVDHMTFGGA